MKSLATILVSFGVLVFLGLFCVSACHAQGLGGDSSEWEQSLQQFTSQCEAWGGHTTPEMDGQTHCVGIRGEPDCDIAWSGLNAGPNGACKLPPPDSSSAGGSATNASNAIANEYLQLDQQMAYQLGLKLHNWLFGNPQQEAKQQALQQRREALAEYQRIQAERAEQRKWRQELAELNWAGPKTLEDEQPFESSSNNYSGGGRDVRKMNSVARSFSNATNQLRIANCLLKMAAAPGRSPSDAKFLSNQAALAMNGQPVQVDTSSCQAYAPPPPPPPSAATLTHDQATLLSQLVETTNQNAKKSVELAKTISQLDQAIAKDEQAIQAKQQQLNKLQSAPPSPVAAQGAPAQSNALAEAEAALQQAEQVKNNDDQALSHAQNQMNDLSQKLKQAQTCFSQAQSDPAKAKTLMKSCGP